MTAELPTDVDYRRRLADGGVIDGWIPAARLTRVGGNFRVTGPARAQLSLRRDGRGRIVVSGSYTAPLEAQCQRCLEWMALTVEGRIEVIVVESLAMMPKSGEEEEDDEDYVEAPDGRLPLTALVEDELLLACPMIPVHETDACQRAVEATPAESSETHYKPFADLAALVKAARETDD